MRSLLRVVIFGDAPTLLDAVRLRCSVIGVPVQMENRVDWLTRAAAADLAIVEVDASHGVLPQTRRHTHLLAVLGVPQVVLAINKMDAVNWNPKVFAAIDHEWRTLASSLGLSQSISIPLAASLGDNLAQASAHMPWYPGPTLMQHLESCTIHEPPTSAQTQALPAQMADQFECSLVWTDTTPVLVGRPYWLEINGCKVLATVTQIKYEFNPQTEEHLAARALELNTIGVCTLSLDQVVAFDPTASPRSQGGFRIMDRRSNKLVGTGRLRFALRRAQNLRRQNYDIDAHQRAALLGQKPAVVWLTGLSGAGKSALANHLATRLHASGRLAYVLDGDNIRHGLNRDLGFTQTDRVENIRRAAEVARLMADAGLIVITAFISPFRSERDFARSLLPPGQFVEVHVDVSLAVAEARDAKGLYAKARRGELPNFTGIDSPYEAPLAPELHLDHAQLSLDEASERVLKRLQELRVLPH